ncbi:TraM recognition domain-containing protein [uncultured Sulfitobacter sp.]|uniref:type IV secretory system conjugative DNA transfer family protein n=1 Tax=uncultured Sulfitobacter sp. TaxID=191468 RepID=UPI00260ECAD4|nr:TraM recognition domain-containing protein [uncultured Sulfitobacter sp.]
MSQIIPQKSKFGQLELVLGTVAEDVMNGIGQVIETPDIVAPEKARQRHMHIVGSNGSGKSRFMRTLIQQDIREGRGLCLIDPHGTQCQDILKWLANRPRLLKHRKVRYFQIGRGESTVAFNPLAISDVRHAHATATRVADAIGRLFSEEELRHQPRTHEVLVLLLMTLAEAGLTLADYPLLLNPRYRPDVQPLMDQLQNRLAKEQWALLTRYKDNDFLEYVSSVSRRLFTLMANPVIGATFSQVETAIDLRASMDRGEILLFDLKDTEIFDKDVAQLFGLLLISSLFGQSKLRDNTRPYFLYLDEAHRYLSGSNVSEMFEECRKYGLHLVLAHQNLGQLRDAGERVFSTVINEAEVKAVFSIKEPDDAAYLVRLMYRGGMIDPTRVKDVLTKPTVVGYSIGYLEGQSLSESSVSGTGQNSVAGSAISLTPDAGMLMSPTELGQMTSQSSSDVQSRAQGNAKTTSKSQTLMPVIEDRASGTWPIEEQIFVLADDLASLPTQYGVISIGGRINMKFRALDAPDEVVSSSVFNSFLERLVQENPYLVGLDQTEKEVPDLPKRAPPREVDFLE